MQVISKSNTVMFDIDGTLVREFQSGESFFDSHGPTRAIPHPLRGGDEVIRVVMVKNANLLKDMHARGRFVIVWSAGGYQWAESVVRALQLEPYVDLIMEKPIAYVDDLTANEFMGQRIFLND